ncbi:DUF5655 domain-containing protein [Rhodococcus zopfii]|uniref:DUF5655 domain-containing protein n=1 Tax=Rhodococcus zopfii TaxID=43772 RepID=UPI0009353715|nr:DUF5655 domain-containing protein [Rhodococcus zopfii]
MYASVDDYLADKDPAGIEGFLRFRDMVLALGPDVDERVRRSDVAWARDRVFAAAFVYSTRLEVAIDLQRRIHHPQLREAFPTTDTVTTHRLSIISPDQLDDHIATLLAEAYKTAGTDSH